VRLTGISGVTGLDDEAVMAQALMPFLAGPIESSVPPVSREEGLWWRRGGFSGNWRGMGQSGRVVE